MRRYDVKGVPTIVFLDARGAERAVCVDGFYAARPILGHMAGLKKSLLRTVIQKKPTNKGDDHAQCPVFS